MPPPGGKGIVMITSKRGFSALFEPDDDDADGTVSVQDRITAARFVEEQETKRRKESYVLHVGPRFRHGHKTPYR